MGMDNSTTEWIGPIPLENIASSESLQEYDIKLSTPLYVKRETSADEATYTVLADTNLVGQKLIDVCDSAAPSERGAETSFGNVPTEWRMGIEDPHLRTMHEKLDIMFPDVRPWSRFATLHQPLFLDVLPVNLPRRSYQPFSPSRGNSDPRMNDENFVYIEEANGFIKRGLQFKYLDTDKTLCTGYSGERWLHEMRTGYHSEVLSIAFGMRIGRFEQLPPNSPMKPPLIITSEIDSYQFRTGMKPLLRWKRSDASQERQLLLDPPSEDLQTELQERFFDADPRLKLPNEDPYASIRANTLAGVMLLAGTTRRDTVMSWPKAFTIARPRKDAKARTDGGSGQPSTVIQAPVNVQLYGKNLLNTSFIQLLENLAIEN